jgi:hypothetical protein
VLDRPGHRRVDRGALAGPVRDHAVGEGDRAARRDATLRVLDGRQGAPEPDGEDGTGADEIQLRDRAAAAERTQSPAVNTR